MLNLLPALILSGFLISAAEMQRESIGEKSNADAMLFSMVLHHKSAFESAKSEGFLIGELTTTISSPIKDVHALKSQIALLGNRKILVTSATIINSKFGKPWKLSSELNSIPRLAFNSDDLGSIIVGNYNQTVAGKSFVDSVEIPIPIIPIAEKAPVIASWIR